KLDRKIDRPGDKTMVDTLVQAVEAGQEAINQNSSLDSALAQVAVAAQKGAESTQDMIAQHGRAKFLGERSKGFQDAGATSMALLLKAWAEAI
ncbi:MAG: DAK2 domain-containing protein, partial [Chloroflexota bacterium]